MNSGSSGSSVVSDNEEVIPTRRVDVQWIGANVGRGVVSARDFAAGDVVESLDQISVTMGQAAQAATAIHNMLRLRESE